MKVFYDGSYFSPSGRPTSDSRLEWDDWKNGRGRYGDVDFPLTLRWNYWAEYELHMDMIEDLNSIMEESGLIKKVIWRFQGRKGHIEPLIELEDGALEEMYKRTTTKCFESDTGCLSFPYGVHAGHMITSVYKLRSGKGSEYIVIPMQEPYALLLWFSLKPNHPRKDGYFLGKVNTIGNGLTGKGSNYGIWCIAHNLQYGYYHVWGQNRDFINWLGKNPLEVKE